MMSRQFGLPLQFAMAAIAAATTLLPGVARAQPPATSDVAVAPVTEPVAPVEATPAPIPVAEPFAITTPVVAVEPAAAEEPHARLDYSGGSFYLRSVNDNVVFVPAARMHIDTYAFGARGLNDYHRANGTGLKTNLYFRRFVIEFGGVIRHRWFYWVGGNFAPTTIDGVQNSTSTANVYDGFVGMVINPNHRLYVGQFNAPFTMENVTSSRWMDLMERALSVRTLATPYNKADGFLAWGNTQNQSFEYQVGVFGGDGMNRPNVDNAVDGMGRFVFRPLATRSDALRRLHFGVGARVGGRDSRFVRYNAPNLSTPGGFAFWQTQYTDAGVKTDILPAGLQAAASAEVYVPFERWDVRGEVVYIHENRREVADADRATTLRTGAFTGVGAYAQLSFWLYGTPRINGNPAGVYGVTRVPDGLGAQAPQALQLVLRGEIMRMAYSSNSRSGMAGAISANTNNVDVEAYQAGLNYWATKHVRLTAEYSLYHFPGGATSNQAVAPNRATNPLSHAHILNEISFRVGLAL